MNQDFITAESQLSTCVRTSGTLPISLNGHYDHWQKYRGRKVTELEDGIKIHLKNVRFQRSITQIKKLNKKERRLPTLRSGLSKRTLSSKSGKQTDIFEMYNDMAESGSQWWTGSPLPAISQENVDHNLQPNTVKQPFYISETSKARVVSLSKKVRCIKEQEIIGLFPPRTLHIYVASSNSDMSAEREYLEFTVWPYLRHLCLQYNRELIVHDLHTFSEELIFQGRKKYLKEISRSLNQCMNTTSQHIKAVILFGDYFDKKGPPESMTTKELSDIKMKIRSDVVKIKEIQDKIQSLKVRQQQMKQQEFRRESSIDIFNDRERSDIDLINGLKLNTENNRINTEISAMGHEIESLIYKTNIAIIDQWYHQVEDNVDQYVLQPEGEIIKELKSTDAAKLKQGKMQWSNVKDQLCHIISSYSDNLMTQQRSVFEFEIKSLEKLIQDNQCILITRTFNNIPKNDIVKNTKDELISRINDNNQRRFEFAANKLGLLSPADNWEHSSYLKHLATNLQNIFARSIIETIRKEETEFKEKIKSLCLSTISTNDIIMLFSEQEALTKTLNYRSITDEDLYFEIKDALIQIENLILSNDVRAIILEGPPINGKSTVMSTFIQRYMQNISNSNSIFIYRLIGSSYHSMTKVGLLRSISLQIVYETGIEMEVPQEYGDLKTLFYHLTLLINFPVVICIDGLDFLTDIGTDSIGSFDWFPVHNDHFTILISCTVDSLSYKYLQGYITSSNCKFSLVHIEELKTETVQKMVDNFIKLENLSWTNDQYEAIVNNCLISKTVGFVESNLRIARSWSVASSLPRLGPKFELNIHTFFGKLEDLYGEPIIRRLVGYITCFKDGCYVNELIDIMTLDDVIQKYISTVFDRRNFRYTLSLLRCAIGGFEELLEYFLDRSGSWCLKWKNGLYSKVGADRYLLQKDKAPSYHQLISQYYMNDFSDQALLAKIIEDDAIQPNYSEFLIKQELLFNNKFENSTNRFNLRKMLQLPYHLVQSQNSKLAKLMCFFNFYWLQAFVINLDCQKLIHEITVVSNLETEDLEYPILLSTLELSKQKISNDPYQLITQLLGRITDIVRHDVESIEPQKYPNLESLYKSLRSNTWLPSIIPSKSCMIAHEQQEYSTMGFHEGQITCIYLNDTSTIIFASTNKGTLYKWDTTKNRIVSIVLGVGKNIFQMTMGNSTQNLVTAMPESLEIWDLDKKIVRKKIVMIYDMYCLTVSADRSVFSALFFGIFWIASWNFETTELIVSTNLPVDTSGNCGGEITTADVCREFQALAAVKNDNKAILIDIRSGAINPKVLKCKEEGSAVIHVAMSARYYIICNKGLSQKDFVSIIAYMDLFDEEKLQLVRRISGCNLDSIISLSINSVGSHAITINTYNESNVSNISIWNLETEEHKHSSETPSVFKKGYCTDFSRIFLLDTTANVIYKTNLLNSKGKLGEKRRSYIVHRYAINDKYVFVQSEDNAVIEVHNVLRHKVRGRRVLTLPEIANANDIVLSHIDKLIILSKRYFSPNLPDCKEVFQTIKIFDLTKRRIIKEKKDVLIYPSRKSEYLILDKDILLGLSESRSNLVHWNLTTGQFEGHIRRSKEICETVPLISDNRRNTVDFQGRMVSSLERNPHDLVIDTVLVSGDRTILVAAYFTRFLCVFSLTEKCHKINLTSECQMLHLQTAAITENGQYIVQNNYNERSLQAFLTIWNTQTGFIENSLPVSHNVLSVAITSDAVIVALIKENVGGFIWNTSNKEYSDFYRIPGSDNISSKKLGSNHKMEFIKNNEILLIFIDRGFYFWNVFIDHSVMIGSFQPDYLIHSFTYCCDESLIAFLLKGSSELYTLRLSNESESKSYTDNVYLSYFEKDNPNHSDTDGNDD